MRSALRANPDMRLDWSGAEEQQPGPGGPPGAADDNGPAGASGGAADAGEVASLARGPVCSLRPRRGRPPATHQLPIGQRRLGDFTSSG